ncbi:MAG: DUF1987 family protein, partial [Magnetococcales bacterium]|nr:DUF1987 family protein [Magnetococcales bacterium]
VRLDRHGDTVFSRLFQQFKVVMRLFELLEETAENGVSVTVNWVYEEDDDNMEELGEEFGEDLETATFNMCPIEE